MLGLAMSARLRSEFAKANSSSLASAREPNMIRLNFLCGENSSEN